MIKKAIKAVMPYGLLRLLQKLREPQPLPSGSLFGGDDELFKSLLKNSRIYGEYGCGASTRWVLSHTKAQVFAVNTIEKTIEEIISGLDPGVIPRANLHYVDLGALGAWGRILSYEKRQDFISYTNWIWDQPEKPDTVLIDGRFRVSCFLTCLKFAEEGTKLIFDDYINRPHYHIVENFLHRAEVCGRQCLFIVPNSSQINYEHLDAEIRNFRHVMD